MAKQKSTFKDRMNYTDTVETNDLMSKQEREAFEKMTHQQQVKFINEVIIPRGVALR